jgi:hypothetical protein
MPGPSLADCRGNVISPEAALATLPIAAPLGNALEVLFVTSKSRIAPRSGGYCYLHLLLVTKLLTVVANVVIRIQQTTQRRCLTDQTENVCPS